MGIPFQGCAPVRVRRPVAGGLRPPKLAAAVALNARESVDLGVAVPAPGADLLATDPWVEGVVAPLDRRLGAHENSSRGRPSSSNGSPAVGSVPVHFRGN